MEYIQINPFSNGKVKLQAEVNHHHCSEIDSLLCCIQLLFRYQTNSKMIYTFQNQILLQFPSENILGKIKNNKPENRIYFPNKHWSSTIFFWPWG